MKKYLVNTKDGLFEMTKDEIRKVGSYAYCYTITGVEVKAIEYGIEDYLFITLKFSSKTSIHRLKIHYTENDGYIILKGYRLKLSEFVFTRF